MDTQPAPKARHTVAGRTSSRERRRLRAAGSAVAPFLRRRDGGVLALYAMAVPALMGIAALSVDSATWYVEKRSIQDAADTAAIAGAAEILRTGGIAAVADAARAAALDSGVTTVAGDTLDIHHPPVSGAMTGAGDSVEVAVERPLSIFFAALVDNAPSKVVARAVAVAGVTNTCVWALNPTARGAITVSGGALVNIGCGLQANSSDGEAISQSGSSCLTAAVVKAVGGANGVCINPTPLENVLPRPDPLVDLQPPPHGGCDHNGKTKVNNGGTATLSPGVYCGAIEIGSSASVHFEPGTYVLDGAGLSVGGQATVTGSDVSFYQSAASGPADRVSIQGGANVDLTAPEDGPLPGVLFYRDRDASSNVTHSLTGGSGMSLEGIVYFPTDDLKVAGGNTLDMNKTMIVGDTVEFTGNTQVGGVSGSVVSANPNLVDVQLVE